MRAVYLQYIGSILQLAALWVETEGVKSIIIVSKLNHYWLFVISIFKIRAILIIFKNFISRLSKTKNQKYICFCKSVRRRRPILNSRWESKQKTILFSILSIFEIFKFVTNRNRVKLSPIHNFMNQTISHFSHSIHNVFEFFFILSFHE